MKTWYYEKNGAKSDAVSIEELIRLLELGEITSRTLVWRKGMAEWQPLRDADALVTEDGEELAICAHSGEVMLKSAMMPYGDDFINPDHRDAFVQDIMEGADTTTYDEDGVVPADYQVRIFDCLGRAWKTLTWNFWPIVGITFLIMFLWNAAYATGVGFIVVAVPIFAGLYYYLLKQVRRQPSKIDDAFRGFSTHCARLILINVVQAGIFIALYIPFVVMVLSMGVTQGGEPSTGAAVGMGISMIVFMLGVYYCLFAWAFAAPLCMEKDLSFWAAMRASMKTYNKHFFSCTLFWIVLMIINTIGFFLLCLGALITVPWTLLAAMHLYDDIFGGRREFVRAQLMR